METKKFSSEHISEHKSFEDNFETIFQAKISPYNQNFEQPEE